jgi:SAC3/GANP family
MEPYAMCSKQEFVERIKCNEISIFERNANDGSPDPRKVITKYRRSAAGSRQRTPRSLRQLSLTVRYLVRLLAQSYEENGNCNHTTTTTTFLAAVQFFEDRIRAVQVDLTRSSRPASGRNNNNHINNINDDPELIAPLQVMIGRAQILILFLMSSIREDDEPASSQKNRPPKNNHHYERKFGVTALQTALSSYLTWIERVQNGQSNEWKDQMMAFSILSMVNEMLRSSSSSGGGATTTAATPETCHVWMEVARLARTNNSKQQPDDPFGPRTQWAVRLLVKICRGEWQQTMAQLRQPNEPDHGRSGTIVEQCCIDQEARRYLQWRTLQTFNVVLSKGQTITVVEVARLLGIVDQAENGRGGADDDATSRRTVHQLVRRFGLPVTETGDKVIFKEVAMLPPSANAQPPKKETSIVSSNVMTSTGRNSQPKLALLPLIMDGLAVETV